MELKCEYCQIPGAYGNIIYETEYWQIYLAPSQRYFGTCVVVLKRHCSDLKGLKSREWDDFKEIIDKLEITIKKTFNPTLFNWSCFMNSAYREHSPNPEVHWHFIPRYDYKFDFEGLEFEDPDFGYIPRPIERKVPKRVMEKIMQMIKENL
ncbi:HIT family protein [Methanobacterium sp. ACI-7]|uniref:HIT family protein n=1 Tax=unclassified Methanobacterium TaxID=2627676 RepID=UPI0039C1B295